MPGDEASHPSGPAADRDPLRGDALVEDPTLNSAPSADPAPVEKEEKTALHHNPFPCESAPESGSALGAAFLDPSTILAPPDLGDTVKERAPEVKGFTPVRRLGAGTYGQVWLYQEDHCNRRVAIKFLTCRASQMWLLLQAEVRQLAVLDGDPGIIQLRDVEPDANPPYYIMTYAEGGSLAQRLSRGALPVTEAVRLFRQITQALAYVHAKNVRHCDLKPGNILLDKVGRPLLADFGQAHLETDRSPALGTFFYMAPEQAQLSHATADSRWDVYALGALLYAMLTGIPPRCDATIRARLAQTVHLGERLHCYRDHVRAAPPPEQHRQVKGIDRPLIEIIDRCLELDPARRFPDAGAILAALERRDRRRRRRPLFLFSLAMPVLLLLAMGGFASWATTDAVARSETALVQQLQESDRASAHLIANVVYDELLDRKHFVEARVRDRALPAALQGGDLAALLERFHQQRARHRYDAWFLADPTGKLLAYHPPTGAPLPQTNFAWRDWFNGRGDQKPDHRPALPPIRKTHISHPYLGKMRQGVAMAISTPIWDPADREHRGEPLAILVARFPVEELYTWLNEVKIRNGFPVLFNERYQCLLHQYPERIAPGEGTPPPEFCACSLFHRVIDSRETGSDTYCDPIDHKEYLVSYAPLQGKSDRSIHWGVLVQHERAGALEPIAQLSRSLWVIGTCSLVSAALLTLTLWGWLIWTLRQEELRGHG